MTDRFVIGTVAGTHGIKGDVKVFPMTDDPQRFKKLKTVLLDNGKCVKEIGVSNVRFSGKFVILHLEGYEVPETSRLLLRSELCVRREDAIKLPEGQYFIPDLIGMKVFTDENSELGTLTDVIKTGANDVYTVTTPEGKNILIPVIDQCILDVNIEEGTMLVHLLPGLLDL